MSIDGEVLVVGAAFDDHLGGDNAGSAYVFRFDGATWIEEQQLVAELPAASDFFGQSVAISGNLAVSGAVGDDDAGSTSGSAYVFRFDNSVWSQEMKLTASDGAANDEFGFSAALSGEVAVIGAPNHDDGGLSSGSAYVYRFNQGTQTWDEEQKLTASDATSFSQFGWSVSIEGNLIVAGAKIEGAGSLGAAYVFRFDGSTWIEEEKLTASDATNNDNFGYSVSVSQNAVVIGAPLGFGTDGGRAYVFRYDPVSESWEEEQQLTGCDQATGDEVGRSVSISGDRIVVGARLDDDAGTDSGSAHVFCFDGSAWTQVARLTAFDGAAGDNFGASVSISGNVAALGAPVDASFTGAMYVFEGLGSCDSPADISGPLGPGFPDGCVDAFDLGTLLGAWCSAALDPDPPGDVDPPCEGCTSPNANLADLSGPDGAPDGCVDAFDLAKLLANWCSVAGGNPCGTCGP